MRTTRPNQSFASRLRLGRPWLAPLLPPGPLVVLLFQVATVTTALLGVARLAHLYRLAADRRVARLALFFGLFAAAVAVQVFVTWSFVMEGRPPPGAPRARPPVWTAFAHHALMLAALSVAVRAYGGLGRQKEVAAAALGPMLFGRAGLLRMAEAGIALYIAVRALLNYRQRRNPGSLVVASGFALFFLAHLSFWIFQPQRGPRPYWAELLTLTAIILLVSRIPGRRS